MKVTGTSSPSTSATQEGSQESRISAAEDAIDALELNDSAQDSSLSALGAVDLVHAAMLPLGGELGVLFAYMNTDGATSLQLNAATDKAALGFVAPFDFEFDTASWYKNAVGTPGNLPISLHADGLALEPNGSFNGNQTPIAGLAAMTANNSPAPYVVGIYDSAGADAEAAGNEAYKAFDAAANTDARSNAAPSAPAPIYVMIALGPAQIINIMDIVSGGNGFPSAWELAMNVEATPTVNNDAHWSALTSATAQTDPGANGFRRYTWTAPAGTGATYLRLKTTGVTGAVAYLAIRQLKFYVAQSRSAPGTRLDDPNNFGNFDGTGAAAWGRLAFGASAYQCQRGKKYWLCANGADGVDVSLALGRVTGTNGTEFPDYSECLFSTDTGTTWSQSVISNAKAMLCCVLNSTTNHVPKLWYGRKGGMYDSLPSGTMTEIPAAGISYACDELTASVDHVTNTKYYIYEYDNSGTLALELSTTGYVLYNGVEVKSGDTTRRFLGILYVKNLIGVYQGPVDVGDWRGLDYHGADKLFQKRNPYVGSTANTTKSQTWEQISGDSSFKIIFASIGSRVAAHCPVDCGTANFSVGFMRNGVAGPNGPTMKGRGVANSSVMATYLENVEEGLHGIEPVIQHSTIGATLQMYYDVPGYNIKPAVTGHKVTA